MSQMRLELPTSKLVCPFVCVCVCGLMASFHNFVDLSIVHGNSL